MYDEDGHWNPKPKTKLVYFVWSASIIAGQLGMAATMFQKGSLWLGYALLASAALSSVMLYRARNYRQTD